VENIVLTNAHAGRTTVAGIQVRPIRARDDLAEVLGHLEADPPALVLARALEGRNDKLHVLLGC